MSSHADVMSSREECAEWEWHSCTATGEEELCDSESAAANSAAMEGGGLDVRGFFKETKVATKDA